MTKRYNLDIKIEHPGIVLCLKEQGKENCLDTVSWADKNDLSTSLLSAIDRLLKKNKIKISQLNTVNVLTDQKTFTSSRIAEAVALTARYCLTNLPDSVR